MQPFGDEDDIDARETFVQESDVPTVFLRLVLLVKNGSVISLTYAVDDLCCLVRVPVAYGDDLAVLRMIRKCLCVRPRDSARAKYSYVYHYSLLIGLFL